MGRPGNVLVGLAIAAVVVSGSARAEGVDRRLIAHWVFDATHCSGQSVKDLRGGNDVRIAGPVRFGADLPTKPLLLDGDVSKVTVRYDPKSQGLARKAITAEAWIAIEKTVEWANIIGLVSGDKGWQLGYRQSSFSFGVSGKKTKGLTHLRARPSLEWGRWYHVVGTYDGATLRVYVDGRLENTSTAQSGELDLPDKASFNIGTFGQYSPRCWLHEIRLYDRALSEAEIAAHHRAKRATFGEPLRPRFGPVLRRLNKGTIVLRWETETPSPSVVVYGNRLPVAERVVDEKPKTDHRVRLEGIDSMKMYYYRLVASGPAGAEQRSRLYEFDATFDYTPPQATPGPCPYPKDELGDIYADVARRALKRCGSERGYCVVLGCKRGRLAYEIARRSRLKVLAVDEDRANVQAARAALDQAGLYGVKVAVQQASLDELPYGSYLANLIVSEQTLTGGKLPGSASEVSRVLRPCGGVAYLGRPEGLLAKGEPLDRAKLEGWLKAGSIEGYKVEDDDGLWAVIRRGKLPGARDWTHQYAEPGNSGCSRDEGPGGRMQVLWFARPGPRPMTDRGTRAPAPLSTDGRLFIQGDRWLFGLDAYNGTMLWALSIPDLRRANIPRDGSNMTATDDALYLAVRDRCWVLDPKTGERVTTFGLPEASKTTAYDWGYLSCKGDVLFGSAVRRGGLFLGADGEWYDRPDEESQKVVSDYVFAVDRKTGEKKWVYRGGRVINPTLAMGDGRLYFVESRSPAALGVKAGRMADELNSDRYLVCLNARTGKKQWEHYRYFQQAKWVFYLIYAKDTLVALSTSDDYHIYAFDAKGGDPLWNRTYPFRRNHHGGAMQHPVIVGDVVYAEPRAFKLRTGEKVMIAKPPNGCGTVSASANCLLYRDGVHTMYDLRTHRQTKWTGMRPSCWLSLIAAGGLVLAPEGSAGCHCDIPIQTTIAFAPK